MSFKINMDESGVIDVYLKEIIGATEAAEEKYLRRSAQIMKRNIVRNLKHFKSSIEKAGYVHMADDVTYSITKDKYGKKVARVRGGRKTGTKWHLVNDGTYKMDATHFMDSAITQTERDLETITDEEMKKAGL